MKNLILASTALILLTLVVLGCGSINPFSEKAKTNTASNKTLTDKGIDSVVGEETTGIPECDEVMNMIAAEANNPDDGYITKAVKATFLNKIKESIKKSIDESKNNNKNGAADIAKTCRQFKDELVKYKAEEEKKKAQ